MDTEDFKKKIIYEFEKHYKDRINPEKLTKFEEFLLFKLTVSNLNNIKKTEIETETKRMILRQEKELKAAKEKFEAKEGSKIRIHLHEDGSGYVDGKSALRLFTFSGRAELMRWFDI